MRWVLRGLAILSALLCIAIAALWADSFRVSRGIVRLRMQAGGIALERRSVHVSHGSLYWTNVTYSGVTRPAARQNPGRQAVPQTRPHPATQISGSGGSASVTAVQITKAWGYETGSAGAAPPYAGLRRAWSFLGFGRIRATQSTFDNRTGMTASGSVAITYFPLPAVLAVVALMPAWLAVHFYRARRRMELTRGGRCRRCGYDLTGNLSGTCPECGLAATKG